MGLFLYIGRDGPRGAELRKLHRPGHLAHIEPLSAAGRIRFAGPLLDEGGRPRGSLIVLEADDLAAARAVAEADPYCVHGVFGEIEVHRTMAVFPPEGSG